MPDSDFFRGSARPEFSGDSSFTSVGGNSTSSAVQHIFHINHPTNIFVYNYGTPSNSPIAQSRSPADDVNGSGQPHTTTPLSSLNDQAPPNDVSGEEGRNEGLDGELEHGSHASKKSEFVLFSVFFVGKKAGIEEAVEEMGTNVDFLKLNDPLSESFVLFCLHLILHSVYLSSIATISSVQLFLF
ncbi:hypothetical protein V5O48_015842 [Marasmius crinis-equi]|uniref:Uncharacterized protein n=1 Tax=Marasmius crinis-equi TaxID=585013 RepID=A0ABR3ETG6_9AGAR